jgi:hypothetical protein
MGGDSGSDSGSTDNTVRFAPYLELFHKDVLNDQGADWPDKSLTDALNAAFGGSPYGAAPSLTPAEGLYGTGYDLADFPSLYDMFGKFMAGLDIHTLWEQTFNGVIDSSPFDEAIASQAETLDDDLEQRVLPAFEAGMRDIGAIHSSAFATGRSIIYDTRVRAINDFSAKLRLAAVDAANKIWGGHLEWNKQVVTVYYEMLRLAQGLQKDANEHNTSMDAKHVTFDLDLFDYARAMIGALAGSPAAVGPGDKQAGPSQLTKGLSGAVAGAAAGGSYGGWWGAAVGGVLGFAAGYFG